MAIVTVNATATFKREPFIKPPDMQRMLTPLPRAIVTFLVNGQAVTAKPINDQEIVDIQVNLPIEFAYRMIDMDLRIRQDVAFAYQFGGELNTTSAIRGQVGITLSHPMIVIAETFSASPITQQGHWKLSSVPTYIMQSPRAGIAPFMDFRVVNNSAPAGAAGSMNFYCRFYEYDIEQVYMFPPLVPGALTYQVSQ